jgi:hypothetical protein
MGRRSISFAGVVVLALALCADARSQSKAEFELKDGDRVVFYGDSITEQRLYTTYVEHFVMTRYPDRRVTFVNTGWGGDQVTKNECEPCAGVGGLARIQRDVIDHRPTVVTLLFGMNDGRYLDFDPATLKVYEDGLTAIIRELKSKTKARIFVMTPTVYDGTRKTPWSKTDKYNDVLDRYSEAAKAIAAREGLPVIDLHAATVDALRKAKAIKPDYTFVPDGVHPEADGQLVMAAELLRAWGAPADGIEISRQAAPGSDGSISVGVRAPLPWPGTAPSDTLRSAWPAVVDVGQVRLKLTGIPSGSYAVSVDGADAGARTSEELAAGIALGAASPSATEASRASERLVRRREDLFFMRWRQVGLPYADGYRTTSAAVSALDALADEITQRARGGAGLHEYSVQVKRAGAAAPAR